MLHRSRSKELRGTPGPSFMSKKQMGDYLVDLRTNRIPRPSGSRPLPTSSPSKRVAQQAESPKSDGTATIDHSHTQPSSTDKLSGHDSTTTTNSSSSLTTSLNPRDPLKEDKAQARELRIALEQVDLKDNDDQRIENAARAEAEELIWKHNNPDKPYRVSQKVNDSKHTRLGHHARSLTEPVLRPTALPRGGCPASENQLANSKTTTIDFTPNTELASATISQEKAVHLPATAIDLKKRRSFGVLPQNFPLAMLSHRRKSSARRNISGEIVNQSFPNETDKIYEDTAELASTATPEIQETQRVHEPVHVRRNPFARARNSLINGLDSTPAKERMLNRVEIQRNPPSQSRNPGYVSNPIPSTAAEDEASTATQDGDQEVPEIRYKDGLEVRGDDIRAATSMFKKDRSHKLPSPTAVSDTLGRPIVSFDPNWQAKEDPRSADLLQTADAQQLVPSCLRPGRPFEPTKSASEPLLTSSKRNIGTSNTPVRFTDHPISAEPPRITTPGENLRQADHAQTSNHVRQSLGRGTSTTPKLDLTRIPTISEPEDPQSVVNAIPSIAINDTDLATSNAHKQEIRTPTIIIEDDTTDVATNQDQQGQNNNKVPVRSRPPPTQPRPSPRHAATAPPASSPHWSPALRRNAALCAQCALPIAGRIVGAAGARFHPQCFTCFHCNEGLECVDFYPEPTGKRDARLDRIERRMNGEEVEETTGSTAADDGDDSLRFYCHLDFHEFFSPRCKSCKTPIEGEVIVACGAEWHAGHFFCAQCGDPFDPSTPFVEKDGYAWCVNCHTNRYSAKCKKCRRPVTNTVLKALGGEWHEDCFSCTECNGKFEDGRYFLRGDSLDPVCFACEDRRLKA